MRTTLNISENVLVEIARLSGVKCKTAIIDKGKNHPGQGHSAQDVREPVVSNVDPAEGYDQDEEGEDERDMPGESGKPGTK